jgi:hypothetical protein
MSPDPRRQSLVQGLSALLFCVGMYQQAANGFDSRFVLFAQAMHGQPTQTIRDFLRYSGTAIGALPPVLSERFDKNDFVLLHYLP